MQTRRSSRAVVVDVIDWDLCHSKLVENSLSASRIAITIACYSLIDIVVIDLCIQHSLYTGFKPELCIVDLATRLNELGHANAKDVRWLVLFDNHDGGFVNELKGGIWYYKIGENS